MRSIRSALLAFVLFPAVPAGAQDCVEDHALSLAAAELLSDAERPSPSRLREAARRAGSDAVQVTAGVWREGEEGARGALLRDASERWRAPLACGEARSEGLALLLVGPAAGHLEPIDGDLLRVQLSSGWHDARVELRDRRGDTFRRTVRAGDEVGPPSDFEAPVTVQLVATGPSGPRPIAERVLGEGAAPEIVDSDEPIALRLEHLRSAARAGETRSNRLLARVARGHAETTCRSGRVAHVAEDADPVERLAREGIRARHVGETIARAERVSGAWSAMLRSPSHRAALTDPRFTDVGVGEASDEAGRVCLVVLLAAWPRAVPYR